MITCAYNFFFRNMSSFALICFLNIQAFKHSSKMYQVCVKHYARTFFSRTPVRLFCKLIKNIFKCKYERVPHDHQGCSLLSAGTVHPGHTLSSIPWQKTLKMAGQQGSTCFLSFYQLQEFLTEYLRYCSSQYSAAPISQENALKLIEKQPIPVCSSIVKMQDE